MTILLIRHGSAGDPYRWSGDDADRPLDNAGTDQATRLADKVDALLAGRPLSEVRSSRAIRCLQTVGPAAARHALLPESDPSLFEGSSSAMTDLVRTRAGADGADQRVVVLCSHADVIIGKFLRGEFPTDEGIKAPRSQVVSLYIDQVGPLDSARLG